MNKIKIVVAVIAFFAAALIGVNRSFEGVDPSGRVTSLVVVVLFVVAATLALSAYLKHHERLTNSRRISRQRGRTRATRNARSVRNGRRPIPYH